LPNISLLSAEELCILVIEEEECLERNGAAVIVEVTTG
jgi:hypothetical protein